MNTADDDFNTPREALSRARATNREITPFDLSAALDELHGWLADEHHVASTYAVHWASLVDDVLQALGESGPRLKDAVLAQSPRAVDELQACRGILKGARNPPDRSLRRRIGNVVERLVAAQTGGETLVAAFGDLLEAGDTTSAEAAARRLLALAELAGHDSTWLPGRLSGILNDSAMEVAVERGEDPPDDPHGRAGLSPAVRLELAEGLLRRAPRASRVIVWLRFAYASLGWAQTLAVGEEVHLFSDEWLRSSLMNNGPELAAIAPESAHEHKVFDLRLFTRADREPDEDEPGATPEGSPSVYIRVETARATAPHAVTLARRTADALAGFLCLYGGAARLWQLEDSYLCLTEDETGGSSYSPSARGGLSVEDRVALESDESAQILTDNAERLGRHFPVRDPAMTHAATLLTWLRQARLTEAPPRLLLCDRVVEQVSGWAGFASPKQFAYEFLKISWAYRQVRRDVSEAAFSASMDLEQSHSGRDLLEVFPDGNVGFGGTVNLQAFLEHADDIAARLGDFSNAREKVMRLNAHLKSPRASEQWLAAYEREFGRLEARRRRTRNALVHGGPLPTRTVTAIVGFAEALAVNALGVSIEGRLADRNLIDHFLERRAELSNVTRRLRNGEPLHQALFWTRD